MRRAYKYAVLTAMIVSTLALALAVSAGGLGYALPFPAVRNLAYWYLKTTYNPFMPKFTASAPEAVTAIVWDYRGLDTLFETSVFFLAIIASMALMRGIDVRVPESISLNKYGMSAIVKTVTKITVAVILAASASIALHGQLTPGGGFQGGATAAVAPLVIIVIFSLYFAVGSGIKKKSMLTLRTLGLLGIGVTSFAVIVAGLILGKATYIFQNQPKEAAPVGLPSHILGIPMGGTLLLFNIFEFLAVAAGFTIVFLLLSVPEESVREALEGGEEHD